MNTKNKISFIKSCEETEDLINKIDNYITQNEGPQLNDLQDISKLSSNIYGIDKTVTLYSDNIKLFQSFFKLKSDLKLLNDQLKQQKDDIEKMQLKDNILKIQNEKYIVETKIEQMQQQIETQKSMEQLYKAPIFTQPLCDATIQEGDKFTFECYVIGYPEPMVEWFKDGMSIQNNPDYLTINNKQGLCTLSIEETFTEDSARFMCKASNSIGVTETTAILSVKESAANEILVPPTFIKLLENGLAREGTSFEFQCIVNGNPLPTVQWYKNDSCVDNSPDYVISYNNGEAILRFEEVFLEDQAVFTCRASNPIGVDQCSASLCVERKCKFFLFINY